MTRNGTIEWLQQREWREKLIPGMHLNPWLTVYQRSEETCERLHIYCGLLPNVHIASALRHVSWDYQPYEVEPGFTGDYTYHRFGFNRQDIEPLVLVRDFRGHEPKQLEFSEEFRLYHNLYEVRNDLSLVKYNEAGISTEVVRYCDSYAKIRRKELRQFLAAKSMALVVFFERICYAVLPPNSILQDERQVKTTDTFCFQYFLKAPKTVGNPEQETYSRVLGKRIIAGFPREKCGKWPYEDEVHKEYVEFALGADEHDDSVTYTCDPISLGPDFADHTDTLPDY